MLSCGAVYVSIFAGNSEIWETIAANIPVALLRKLKLFESLMVMFYPSCIRPRTVRLLE